MPYGVSGSTTTKINHAIGQYGLTICLNNVVPSQYRMSSNFDITKYWILAFHEADRNYFKWYNQGLIGFWIDSDTSDIKGIACMGRLTPYISDTFTVDDSTSNSSVDFFYINNPYIEAIHIPLTYEYTHFVRLPTTENVNLTVTGSSPVNGVSLSISHAFKNSTDIISSSSAGGCFPVDFCDTKIKPTINVDLSNCIKSPLSGNWCFKGKQFSVNISLKRKYLGWVKHYDTGTLLKIPILPAGLQTKTAQDLFLHTSPYTQTFNFNIENYDVNSKRNLNIDSNCSWVDVPITIPQILAAQLGSSLDYKFNGKKQVTFPRCATVTEVSKHPTANNKLIVKCKDIVAGETYEVCMAGLTGNQTTLPGKILKDKYGNELENVYKHRSFTA